jgi:PAS domain S-box-containing protein
LAQQVIIIESELINTQVVESLLKSQFPDIEISLVGKGKSALKYLENNTGDLVLAGCTPAEIEVAAILFKTHEDIPVIIFIDDRMDAEACKKLLSRGLTSYIRLPLNEKDLFAIAGMALQNKKLKDEIRYQSKLLKLIRNLDSKFINIKSDLVDEAINESLSEIGKFTSVDRVYLFDYHFDRDITTNTHEWCAPGISKEMGNLQDVPLHLITDWINTHKKGETVYLPKVNSLDIDDTHRKMLEPQNIKSILTIPLFFENECFGFVGFDSCKTERKWEDDEVSVLQLFADLMTNLKIKKKFTNRLLEVESIYRFIANNINDAVALIDSRGNYTFISPSHKNLTGRGEEIIGQNAFQFIHPDEYRLVLAAVLKAKKSNQEYRVEYRYLHAEQGYIWVESLGKKHLDGEGNVMGLFATRNIHEKKISQDALYETRSILQNILDTIPVRVFWKDKELKYLGCNLPFALDTGASGIEEVIGKDDYEMPWKNEAELYRNDDRQVIETGSEKIGYEEPQTSPEGENLWLRTSKVPLKNRAGETIGVLGTYENITAGKLLENELRESELRYRTLIETSQDGISLMDLQGNILYANENKAKMAGFSNAGEIIGKNGLEMLHPDDKATGLNILQDLVSLESVSNLELRVKRKDGSFFYASFNVSLVKDEDGLPLYIIDFMQDITSRIEAQNALRAERDFAEQVMNTMGQGLTVTNGEGLFEYVNPAYAKIIGVKPEKIIGKSPRDFTPPSDHFILENVQIERLKGRKSSYETRLIHADGHEVPVWITGVPVMKEGKFSGTIAVISDISERIKTEEALRESEFRFQLLAEVAPVGIFRTDATGYTNYVNPRWCEISKLSYEKALGSGWINSVHPDDRSKLEAEWEKATKNKTSSETEYRFLRPDGSIAWVIGRAVPQKNKKGVIIGYIGTITDITERKRNEAILFESEERYRLLFESNPAPMVIYEKEKLKILTVNKAFEKHYGYSKKEAANLLLTDLYPEKDRKPMSSRVRQLIGSAKMGERFHQKKDGTYITVISSSHDLTYLGKNARISVITDITERKKIEEALRESEERFRRLAENADDAIYRVEFVPEQKFTYVSPAIEKLTGYSPEDHYNDPLLGFKIVHPDDRYLLEKVGEEPGKLREPITLRWVGKDGKITWTEQKNVPLFNKKGQLIAIEGIARDVTWRKLQEEEIKKLSKGIEQSPVLVMITDTKGNIDYVNQKFTEVTGYKKEEVIGKNPRILKSGNKPAEEYLELWQTISAGDEWRGEFLNRKKNGELYWESASISPIRNEKGEIAFYIGVKEDITERKKMEDELLAAKEKAEESDRLKTAFLNNMSHEIRTPLNAITGFSELLNSEHVDHSDIQQFTSVIRQSSSQLLSIIDDIVNIATIEAGQVKIIHQKTDINKVFKNIFDQIKIKVREKNISLEIEKALPDKESHVITDETKLTQILSNLIVNAIKFTEKGLVKYGCEIKEHDILFYVSDTGIGIPQELHEKIFERFRQSDLSISRKYGGTGLGLSISKSYVEFLGGKIWLKSRLGEGSTFYFTIPFIPAGNLIESESYTEKVKIEGQKTILIVEDEDFNFLLTQRILADYNLNIIRSVNGFEAVEICKANPEIRLVLMDIKIPGISGYEATSQIKKFRPHLPIIALTAYAQEGSREEALASGCEEYISKPFKREELLLLMTNYLK